MELFTTVYQPLLNAPLAWSSRKAELPPGTILTTVSEFEAGAYKEVEYHTNSGVLKGWVKSKWVEPFILPEDRVLKINSGTLSKSDAAQYMFVGQDGDRKVEYNLCGEFCVAYCAEWLDFSVDEWLDAWREKDPKSYWNVFKKRGVARTTGIPDLDRMLATFDGYAATSLTIQDELGDLDLRRPLMTPGRLAHTLRDHRVIIGCTIETQFGQLRPSGTPHWVVAEKIQPIARGGLVSIYNPFGNVIEWMSWAEFAGSVKIPYGIIVPR